MNSVVSVSVADFSTVGNDWISLLTGDVAVSKECKQSQLSPYMESNLFIKFVCLFVYKFV